MFSLFPRDMMFFDLFEGIARHAVSCANHLHHLTQSFPDIQPAVARIKQEEHDADTLAHQALNRLDRARFTPLDRQDIHMLVGQLDNIVDNINALAKRFNVYHVKAMDPHFVKQAEILVQATIALSDAIHKLRKTRKLADMSERIIEVHRLENVGDDNYLAAISRLLDGTTDPLEVIKWREFYQLLEKALDACEDATNIIERIMIKNA